MYDKIDNIYLALIERRKLVKRKVYLEEALLLGWYPEKQARMKLDVVNFRLIMLDERMRELNHG